MKINQIFSKNIDRQINPAVVVSKQDIETVNSEIEEYVFTQSTIDNLYKFLDNLFYSKNDKTGIWINGFYGSGKSHFIKYIYYCLNKNFSDKAFQHYINSVKEITNGDAFSDATVGNISMLQNKIKKTEIDTIIFNIDAVSGQRNENDKITKIFFNQFNGFRGYSPTNITLAVLLEKHLDQINKFEEFKKAILDKLGTDWVSRSAQLISLRLKDILSIVTELDPTIDTDSLRNSLKNPDDITIANHLLPEFIEYLATKPKDYRLIFLVDEISQYIGTNTNLLLNLQTIVEELGAKCESKIWLTTTAQQTIEDFVGNTDTKGEDFGKILGRFETRISLESQDTTYITQKRILDKNSDGIGVLLKYYDEHREEIENQFVLHHDTYKSFENKENFILSYPFVPYQFKLIADVFENFANQGYVIKEVKDNERSLLGITHATARLYKEKECGEFITFDAFFNHVMRSNLTHLANKILERIVSIEDIQHDDFALKVVYILFMISNISDIKKRLFPSNMENLVFLLIDTPEITRLHLQQKIQSVLTLLIEKSLVYKENDNYFFYKEEEIEIAKEIVNINLVNDDRLGIFFEDVVTPCCNIKNTKVSFGSNNFSYVVLVDDKQFGTNGDFKIYIPLFDKTSISERLINTSKNDLVCCINDWVINDHDFRKEFEIYVKTKKYYRLNFDSAQGTKKAAMEKFSEQNKRRHDDLKKKFNQSFLTVFFISDGQIVKPIDISGFTSESRFKLMIDKHLSEMYKRNYLAENYAKTNDDLRKSISYGKSADKTLTDAEDLLACYLNSVENNNLSDLINQFQKPPYGWKDISIIDILISLNQKNKFKFEWRNDDIDLKVFVEKSIRSTERVAIIIKPLAEFSISDIIQIKNDFRSIFNEDVKENDDFYLLFEEIKEKCNKYYVKYADLSAQYDVKYRFGKHFTELSKLLKYLIDLRDPKVLFDNLKNKKDDYKKIIDICKSAEDFISTQLSRYDEIKVCLADIKTNLSDFNDENRLKAEELINFMGNMSTPWNKFPQFLKVSKELHTEINSIKEQLKQKLKAKYSVNNKEIKNKADELDYSFDDSSLIEGTNENSFANDSINTLKLKIADADNYKTKVLKKIISESNKSKGVEKQPEIIANLSCVIENEVQLDDYINKLKDTLLKKLKENKILIIQ